MVKKPIDLPPIISIELIQISDITNIPYAPKARKILDKIKKEKERIVSEQAPPKVVKKEKPDAIPLPEDVKKQKKIKTKKQNPKKIESVIKQTSEFEKKELFDPDQIAALIDKSKVEKAETTRKSDKLTQSQVKNSITSGLTLSEEDALKAQIFTCWSVPIGLPFSEDLLVRVKLQLKPDGTIEKLEMLDHIKMNTPGKEKFRTLADSVRRAIQLCNPLKVPTSGYERWKNMILNF